MNKGFMKGFGKGFVQIFGEELCKDCIAKMKDKDFGKVFAICSRNAQEVLQTFQQRFGHSAQGNLLKSIVEAFRGLVACFEGLFRRLIYKFIFCFIRV